MKYVDPTSRKISSGEESSRYVLNTLAGKVIGVLSNDWPSYERMIVRFRELLVGKHRANNVLYYKIPRMVSAPDELFDKVARECDAVIVGLAN